LTAAEGGILGLPLCRRVYRFRIYVYYSAAKLYVSKFGLNF
jgi:hypothetical protein